jgi:hypothetical protein
VQSREDADTQEWADKAGPSFRIEAGAPSQPSQPASTVANGPESFAVPEGPISIRHIRSAPVGSNSVQARPTRRTDAAATIRAFSVPNPETGCWVWAGIRKPHTARTYAFVKIGDARWLAHRLSYATFTGPIPPGMFVCHHCDNPPCVNPAHLFLGTSEENTADRHRKGRDARGERQGPAKLNEEKVREIRALLAKGEKQRDVARRFGVSQRAVQFIHSRRHWAHVPDAPTDGGVPL